MGRFKRHQEIRSYYASIINNLVLRKREKSLIWRKEDVSTDKENVNPGLIDLHNQCEILNKPPSCEPDDVQRPTDIEIVENSMPCDQTWQSISAGRSIKGM